MTQSVTVLSGVSNSSISGLVTVPLDISPSVTALQALLTSESNSVAGGSFNLTNINFAALGTNGAYTTPDGSGILEYTNTAANGSVTGGTSDTVSTYYPAGYNTIIVQAPGDYTVKGPAQPATNLLVVLGDQSQVRFNPDGTSQGNGTIIAGGSGDFVAVNNGVWSIDGSTDGGDSISAVTGGTVTVSTYGQGSAGGSNGVTQLGGTSYSNVVGVDGTNDSVFSGGTDDFVEVYGGTAIVSVNGSTSVPASAVVTENNGQVTVYAGPNSSNVEAFFQSGGGLYFVNQSSVQAFVTGNVAGTSGGNATVFGGLGGGVYTGGIAGSNSLIGGYAPGQTSTQGAGLVTLTGSGEGNFLEATGSVTGAGGNYLIASGDGGSADTLLATATTYNDTLSAGNAGGGVFVSTSGAGLQTFVLMNAGGTETITGSTVAGARNLFIVNDPGDGGGNVFITNFSTASGGNSNNDVISILGGASVQAIASGTGAHSGNLVFQLSDGTNITLTNTSYSSTAYNSYIGKTTI